MADDAGQGGLAGMREADGPAALVHAAVDGPGIVRRRAGKGFGYRDPAGAPVKDQAVLARIRALAIPPAWTGVWICPDPRGHIQAVGVDARGRRQYRYHPAFRAQREEAKFGHMLAFAAALPALRARIAADMARPGLGREKVLATVVHLLDATLIRVGNAEYARANESFGLTTLRDEHVAVEGTELRFGFRGKSGRMWQLGVRDRRVARIVKQCQDLPGQHLFQYLDDAGAVQAVTSADVNAYLKAASGAEITAKDFRTWAGTVLAALALREMEAGATQAAAKRAVTGAIRQVAARLGNTPTICRKCYVHPEIVAAFLGGGLALEIGAAAAEGLRAEEGAVLAFLYGRVTG